MTPGPDPADETGAARVLARFPAARAGIEASPEFAAWLAAQPQLRIDGALFYVVGGDQLRDRDEMALAWALRTGLLHRTDLAAPHREEPQP